MDKLKQNYSMQINHMIKKNYVSPDQIYDEKKLTEIKKNFKAPE
jgi:hypothetical protein